MKTFASLFSGGGGADIGAAMAQFQPIWGIELDPDIAGVFAANLGHQPIIKSVADVNPNCLERPDVLWASPPCQEWSVARSKNRTKRGDADIGYSIIPFLKTLQPKIFILENVEAYRKADVFHAIVNVLHRLGYWVQWEVLNAADFGVPQTRRRLILRAVKDGFVPPLPPIQNWVGWYEAITDLIPTLPESQSATWQIERMPELVTTSLVESRNTIRQSTVRSFDKPAPCVTVTWLHRPCVIPRAFIVDHTGASSSSYAKELVHGYVVAMTPRALARFQSFPDTYQLLANRILASRVIGNAVPPFLVQRLCQELSK